MKGNLNLSIKLANKKYNYISPKQPGTIPKGIIINKKKSLLSMMILFHVGSTHLETQKSINEK